ncbi:hypothetical protein GJ496_005001 [Pomphorhynchus laevis]|nr:hypothetical protein GJ496_005001 [Pomphorhynchus laevis]
MNISDITRAEQSDIMAKYGVDCVNETVFEITQWIITEVRNVLTRKFGASLSEEKINVGHKYQRRWIYSHHIRNPTKRRLIINKAHDFDLTGFSSPGKPGLICVEGDPDNIRNFWQIIRSLRWRKIQLLLDENDINPMMNKFVEKQFVEGSHTNLGELRNFLKNELKRDDIFMLLFNLQNE